MDTKLPIMENGVEGPGKSFKNVAQLPTYTGSSTPNDEIQENTRMPPPERSDEVVGQPANLLIEETEKQRVERLGRERPPQFKSLWAELLFVYSILASQFMAVSSQPPRPSILYLLASLLSIFK